MTNLNASDLNYRPLLDSEIDLVGGGDFWGELTRWSTNIAGNFAIGAVSGLVAGPEGPLIGGVGGIIKGVFDSARGKTF